MNPGPRVASAVKAEKTEPGHASLELALCLALGAAGLGGSSDLAISALEKASTDWFIPEVITGNGIFLLCLVSSPNKYFENDEISLHRKVIKSTI